LDGFLATMSYAMHRIFCATHKALEAERQSFHEVVGEANEKHAMALGILFVPISIPINLTDKRFYQPVIAENVRSSRYYLQVVDDTLGPPEMNFEQDWLLARACLADGCMPMEGVLAALKRLPEGSEPEPVAADLRAGVIAAGAAGYFEYANIGEWRRQLAATLSRWLAETAAMRVAASPS
jgi:hypothetical protein